MNKPIAVLSAHGMNSRSSGKTSIDLVIDTPYADIVDPDKLDYGFVLFGRIWFFKGPRVEKMAKAIAFYLERDYKVIIAAHSNGLNFTIQALKKLEKLGVDISDVIVVALSGCANRKVRIPAIKALHNWYTEKDGWLLTSKWLPSWTMGSFGRSEYRGKTKDVVKNKRITDHISSHSQWFDKKTLPMTRQKFNELVRSYV